MVKKRLSMGMVLLTAMFATANCDSGDTVVSVNFSFDATAMDVQSAVSGLRVTISSGSRGPMVTDIPLMRDADSGTLTSPTYKRIAVNGWSGSVDVAVDALDSSGNKLLSASTTAELIEHAAVAAFVRFARTTPDGGSDDANAGTGGSVGSGGSTGTGGSVGSGGSVGTGGNVASGGSGGGSGGGTGGSAASGGAAGESAGNGGRGGRGGRGGNVGSGGA